MKIPRRLFLFLLFISACKHLSKSPQNFWTIGKVSFEKGSEELKKYEHFKPYLEEKTESVIQFELTFNEDLALERIMAQKWDLIFASPALAAIAIYHSSYIPLFPLAEIENLRSVLVVRKQSSYQDLKSLTNQTVALGQPGSATGYYFPLYNLYGLTLAEILFLPTPKDVLESLAQEKVEAGALSMEEFNLYSTQFKPIQFRLLYNDPHNVPPGTILISPRIEHSQQQEIRQVFSQMPLALATEIGFVPNAPVPDYKYMYSVVERVLSILPEKSMHGITKLPKPVHLFKDRLTPSMPNMQMSSSTLSSGVRRYY